MHELSAGSCSAARAGCMQQYTRWWTALVAVLTQEVQCVCVMQLLPGLTRHAQRLLPVAIRHSRCLVLFIWETDECIAAQLFILVRLRRRATIQQVIKRLARG